MRMIIYGAGAIGGTIGGHLALAGHAVLLVARGAHAEAIRERGLRLVTAGGTHTLRLPVVTSPLHIDWQTEDVVLLTVKGQDTEPALRELASATGDVPVFCMQNGVRNEEVALGYFDRVYAAMLRVEAMHLVPGEVIAHRDPPGCIALGRYPRGVDDLAEAVGAALRGAGFGVLVTPDIMPYKWGKLLSNLANAVGAITGEEQPGADFTRIVQAARTEARLLLEQAGLRWLSSEALAEACPELKQPPRAVVGQPRNSTWQSLARGQGAVETEFLNGEVVRLAERLGTHAPVNAGLTRIALEMAAAGERPGKYSPAELRALLGV